MEHEEALLADICKHSLDDAPRLIYADWLEEQGVDVDVCADGPARKLSEPVIAPSPCNNQGCTVGVAGRTRQDRCPSTPEALQPSGRRQS